MKKKENFVVRGCALVDVTRECDVVRDTDIFVRDGIIERISPTDEGSDVTDYKVIDARGLYAMPGLINAHAHLFGTGAPSKILSGGGAQKLVLKITRSAIGPAILRALVRSSCAQELNSGVTTLRSLGDFRFSDIEVRDEIRKGKGKAAGLNLLVSGPALTAPGGHGDGTFALTASTPSEFAALVAQNVMNGADVVKICITGGVTDAKKKGEPGEVKMTEEQVKAACDRAHKLGKKVAAHIQSPLGVEIAAKCGVDTIEHGAHMSAEAAAALKARGGAVVATYTRSHQARRHPRVQFGHSAGRYDAVRERRICGGHNGRNGHGRILSVLDAVRDVERDNLFCKARRIRSQSRAQSGNDRKRRGCRRE